MTTNVESLAQFDDIQTHLSPKTELIVLFFFNPFHEKDSRTEPHVDLWSENDKYKDRVLFVKCSKESSNRDIFEKYNVETTPTFFFIKNNEQVASPSSGRLRETEKIINDILNGTK